MNTVVITGANRGIGFECTRIFSERGARVFAICRSPGNALASLAADSANIHILDGVDVRDDDGVQRAAKAVEMPVDILVNNAGILRRESLDDLSFSRIENQFATNAIAPLRVSHAFLPALQESARLRQDAGEERGPAKIALITSRMGSIEDNTSGGRYGYRMSKAALNMAGSSLAIDLRSSGIAVSLLHPGFVRTEMTSRQGNVEPRIAAAGLIDRIDGMTLENTGSFWHANGEILPW
jgi:NAD(P)-dependent dehydrogenase (short-subunit alcohol dehydrogenase family)